MEWAEKSQSVRMMPILMSRSPALKRGVLLDRARCTLRPG